MEQNAINQQKIPLTPDAVKTLKLAGHKNSEIARLADVHPSTIGRILTRIDNNNKQVKELSGNLADMFLLNIAESEHAIQRALSWVNGLEDNDYTALPHSAKIGFLSQAVLSRTHAFNNWRLETNQSTSNVDLGALSAQLDQLGDVLDLVRDRRKLLSNNPDKLDINV